MAEKQGKTKTGKGKKYSIQESEYESKKSPSQTQENNSKNSRNASNVLSILVTSLGFLVLLAATGCLMYGAVRLLKPAFEKNRTKPLIGNLFGGAALINLFIFFLLCSVFYFGTMLVAF